MEHIETEKKFIIGCCCIKKFEIKKRCKICNKVHRNIKNEYCNDCRIKINELRNQKEIDKQNIKKINEFSQKIVNIGIYKNKNLKWSEVVNKNYKWCDFISNFLIQQHPIINFFSVSICSTNQ